MENNITEVEVILTLKKSDNRPEDLRVINKDGLFIVQANSRTVGKWIALSESYNEGVAINRCISWY